MYDSEKGSAPPEYFLLFLVKTTHLVRFKAFFKKSLGELKNLSNDKVTFQILRNEGKLKETVTREAQQIKKT